MTSRARRRMYAWSERADSCLLYLRNKGKSFSNIARAIGAPNKDIVWYRFRKITGRPVFPRKPTPHHSWQPEEDDLLRALWVKNISARQISITIGRTRNAVIGRANRLKLTPRAVSRHAPKPGAGRPRPRRSRELRRKQQKYIQDFKVALKRMEGVELKEGVNLVDLEEHHCRFIAGDPLKGGVFCGQEKREGSSYCPEHHAFCFKR